MKSVLLIGSNSYIGGRLYLDLQNHYKLTGTYNNEPLFPRSIHLNIKDKQEVLDVINQIKPDIILHAANNANAKWCESNPVEAQNLNQESTQSIVDAALNNTSKLIYISSCVAANPSNVYAQTKFNSEKIIIDSGLDFLIIRPSLTLGMSPNTTADRPHNRLLKNMKEGTKAVYDNSWKFQPTYIGQISEVIQSSITKNIWNLIIPVASEKLVSRYEIIKDIFIKLKIPVESVDLKDTTPQIAEDLSILERLGLPTYSYESITSRIAEELSRQ